MPADETPNDPSRSEPLPGGARAPLLDYRRRGEAQPRQMGSWDGCSLALLVFFGFLYGIIAPICVVVGLQGPGNRDAMLFTTLGLVLGVPALIAVCFRGVRWAALGILLAVGVYLLIFGACWGLLR